MSSALHVFEKSPRGYLIFTSSQKWTVPAGVHKIKVLAIGGGGGGGGGYSSTYVGGGGGSGVLVFAEMIVQPGIQLNITVGAGGSPGNGGASPTSGGAGGASIIMDVNNVDVYLLANGGLGGGAATSTANGSPAPSNSNSAEMTTTKVPPFLINAYTVAGAPGNGQFGGSTPILAPGFASASNLTYGWAGGTSAYSFGQGGAGGGVNANGQAGMPGVVLIWWGDD